MKNFFTKLNFKKYLTENTFDSMVFDLIVEFVKALSSYLSGNSTLDFGFFLKVLCSHSAGGQQQLTTAPSHHEITR